VKMLHPMSRISVGFILFLPAQVPSIKHIVFQSPPCLHSRQRLNIMSTLSYTFCSTPPRHNAIHVRVQLRSG